MIPMAIVKATSALAKGRSRLCSTENATAKAAAGEAAEMRITFCPMLDIPSKEVIIYAKNTETPIIIPADRTS